MLDLIVLVFLTREIGRLAFRKGLKPLTWRIYNVIGWLFFETIGVIFGFAIFGKDNFISINLIGFAFAITSYFLINARLNKLPDVDQDIDIFGK
ncbi:MAG: hypothetical protein ABI359_09630 [Ginsengibacter sp.]